MPQWSRVPRSFIDEPCRQEVARKVYRVEDFGGACPPAQYSKSLGPALV